MQDLNCTLNTQTVDVKKKKSNHLNMLHVYVTSKCVCLLKFQSKYKTLNTKHNKMCMSVKISIKI